MDGGWLKGSEGDALHSVLRAAGFNIRWLTRALRRQLLVPTTGTLRRAVEAGAAGRCVAGHEGAAVRPLRVKYISHSYKLS